MRFSTAVIAAIGIKTFQSRYTLCRCPAQYNTAIRRAEKLNCAHRVLNFRRFYRRMRPRVSGVSRQKIRSNRSRTLLVIIILFLRRWTRAATDRTFSRIS